MAERLFSVLLKDAAEEPRVGVEVTLDGPVEIGAIGQATIDRTVRTKYTDETGTATFELADASAWTSGSANHYLTIGDDGPTLINPGDGNVLYSAIQNAPTNDPVLAGVFAYSDALLTRTMVIEDTAAVSPMPSISFPSGLGWMDYDLLVFQFETSTIGAGGEMLLGKAFADNDPNPILIDFAGASESGAAGTLRGVQFDFDQDGSIRLATADATLAVDLPSGEDAWLTVQGYRFRPPPGVVHDTPANSHDIRLERLGEIHDFDLPTGKRAYQTNIYIPSTTHVLMIDVGNTSDDFILVDWDVIRALPAASEGAVLDSSNSRTFYGHLSPTVGNLSEHVLRLAHDGSNRVLLAHASNSAVNGITNLIIERMLAPVAVEPDTPASTISPASKDDTAHINALIDARVFQNQPVIPVPQFDADALAPVVVRSKWKDSSTFVAADFPSGNDHQTEQPFTVPDDANQHAFFAIWVAVEGSDRVSHIILDREDVKDDMTPAALQVGGVHGIVFVSNEAWRPIENSGFEMTVALVAPDFEERVTAIAQGVLGNQQSGASSADVAAAIAAHAADASAHHVKTPAGVTSGELESAITAAIAAHAALANVHHAPPAIVHAPVSRVFWTRAPNGTTPTAPNNLTYDPHVTTNDGWGNLATWALESPAHTDAANTWAFSATARYAEGVGWNVTEGDAVQVYDGADPIPFAATYYDQDGNPSTTQQDDSVTVAFTVGTTTGPQVSLVAPARLRGTVLLDGILDASADIFPNQNVGVGDFSFEEWTYFTLDVRFLQRTDQSVRRADYRFMLPEDLVAYAAGSAVNTGQIRTLQIATDWADTVCRVVDATVEGLRQPTTHPYHFDMNFEIHADDTDRVGGMHLFRKTGGFPDYAVRVILRGWQ